MADWWKSHPVVSGDQTTTSSNTGEAGNWWKSHPVVGASSAKGKHLSFEEGQALLEQEARQERMEGGSGAFGAATSGYLEGAPVIGPAIVGGAQRAAAGIASLIDGDSYEKNLEEAQAATSDAQEAHPYITTGAKLTGGVAALAPVAATGLGARALGVAGETILGRTVASTLSGAGIGAADAAVRSNGDLGSTAKGAIAGGAIGIAAPAAGSVIGAGTRKALDLIRRPGQGVERNIAASLAADGIDDAAARARLTELGPEGMIADLGDNLRGDLSAITSMPGRGQTVSRSSLASRNDAAAGRIRGDADSTLGTAGDIIADRAAYVEQRAQAAAPLYQRAYATPFQPTAAIGNILATPAGKQALRNAQRIAQNEGMPIDPEALDVRGLDLVKRSIDDQINVAQRAGRNNEARVLTSMKNKLVGDAPAEYRAALDAFSGPSGVIDALDNGRSVFQRNVHAGEVKAEISRLSGSDRDAYVQGARSALEEMMTNARNAPGEIRAQFQKDANKFKLEAILGRDETKRFLKAIERETTFAETSYAATGNSVTAARQAAQQRWGGQTGGEGPIRAAFNMNFGDALASVGGRLNQVQNEAAMTARRARAADILTARGSDAADRLQSLTFLQRLMEQNGAIGSSVGTGAQTGALAAGTQIPQLFDPR